MLALNVNVADLTPVVSASSVKFVTEASDLRIPPGKWPEAIALVCKDGSKIICNVLAMTSNRDREVESVHYRGVQDGVVVIVVVFND